MSSIREVNKKIENAVVDTYQKVEDAVTGAYQNVEDKFVERFLKEEGETVRQAKARLKGQEEQK